eukprot:3941976-Rhodomonas_salina.6
MASTELSAGLAALIRASSRARRASRRSSSLRHSCSCERSIRTSRTTTCESGTDAAEDSSLAASWSKPSVRLLIAEFCGASCVPVSSTRRFPPPPLPPAPVSMARCSLSASSAKKKSFCETWNTGAPPVCVGVHSYPGFTHHARRCRSLSWYRSAITCEKLRPRPRACSLSPKIDVMNVSRSAHSPPPPFGAVAGSSIWLATQVPARPPQCGSSMAVAKSRPFCTG